MTKSEELKRRLEQIRSSYNNTSQQLEKGAKEAASYRVKK